MTKVELDAMRTTAAAYEPPHLGDALMARLSRGDVPAGLPLMSFDDVRLPDDPADLDRARLVAALRGSYATLGLAAPEALLGALSAGAWLVITGQQPGLLTGPAYGLFKALTAVQLARRLSEQTGQAVLPAFWVAAEDHDLPEVNHAWAGGVRFEARQGDVGPPVEWVSLAEDRDRIVRFTQEQWGGAPFGDGVIAAVESASFENYATQFAHLLNAALGEDEVLLIDPMHLRGAFAPATARVLAPAAALHGALARGTAALQAAGVKPQLDGVSLFEFRDGRRVRCPITEQIVDAVQADPGRYSPGAALRPIVQDAALPVLCTVGGPAEMRYLWQIDPLYEAAGVRRSKLWPRISATVVDGRTVAEGRQLGLEPADLLKLPGLVSAFDPVRRLDGADQTQVAEILTLRDQLAAAVRRFGPGRRDAVIEHADRALRYHVERAVRHAAHQRLAKAGRGKERLTALCETVFPGGAPAERRTCGLDYLARYGPALIEQIGRNVDATVIAHRLIEVQTA